MIKLVASLATARDGIDRAIAYGEAVPRLERIRRIMLWGLTVTIVILSIGYVSLSQNIHDIEARQLRDQRERAHIIAMLKKADIERRILLNAAGKSRASLASTP